MRWRVYLKRGWRDGLQLVLSEELSKRRSTHVKRTGNGELETWVLYEGNIRRLDEESIWESEDEHLIRGFWGHG